VTGRAGDEHVGQFVLHGETIPYLVRFRRRKDMAIHVHPNRRVTIDVPEGTTIDQVATRVARRSDWIAQQRRFFEKFQPLPPNPMYSSGETHRYLGRQYRLKVVTTDRPSETVKLVGRFFWVHLRPGGDSSHVQSLLEGWYRERAREVFGRRLLICLNSCKSLDVATPVVQVRKMVRRWGSCTRNGTILLNLALVKAPVTCIDYVVMHELCHLKEPNHGPSFYRLMKRHMPDWRSRKERLDGILE
jgi:predicted metal-dependent hydrolase